MVQSGTEKERGAKIGMEHQGIKLSVYMAVTWLFVMAILLSR